MPPRCGLIASTILANVTLAGVRGAIFFGSNFFVGAFDLRDIGAKGATLAVLRSTFLLLLLLLLFNCGVVVIDVSARTFKLQLFVLLL